MSIPKFILGVFFVSVCILPGGMASEKSFMFSKSGDWCEVSSAVYKVRIRTAGSFVFDVKDTIEIDASFIQCWVKYQFFPHVKYVEASVKKDKKLNTVTLKLTYFWNDGKVKETLTFSSHSVMVECVYTPFVEKSTRQISFVLGVRKPKKQPENLEIIGIDRSINGNGALLKLGKWQQLRQPRMRMLSVRNAGKYVVDFLADGNAWISLWKWPRMGIFDNGDEYSMWSKQKYMPGEPKVLKYIIEISEQNGMNVDDSPLTFKSLQE
jgi:hypothetical protein